MQKSAYALTTRDEQTLFDQFVTLLSDITTPSDMTSFLTLFLSQTEQSVLAKRLAILIELSQGKSYEEISQELKVSSATISSMATIKDQPIAKKMLQLIRRDQRLRQLLHISF